MRAAPHARVRAATMIDDFIDDLPPPQLIQPDVESIVEPELEQAEGGPIGPTLYDRELQRLIDEKEQKERDPNAPVKGQATAFGEDEDFDAVWKEWAGMPEFVMEDMTPYITIPVAFRNEDDLRAFEALIQQPISRTSSRRIWYPDLEVRHFADKRYRTVES